MTALSWIAEVIEDDRRRELRGRKPVSRDRLDTLDIDDGGARVGVATDALPLGAM